MQTSSLPIPAAFASRFKWVSIILALVGAAALVYLAALPTGEKGFSTSRLAMAGGLLLMELLLGGLSAWLLAGRGRPRLARLAAWIDRRRFEVLGASAFAALSGIYLALRWAFLPPTYETGVTLPRLYPFLLLGALVSAGVLLLALPERTRAAGEPRSWVERAAAVMEPSQRLPRLLAWLNIFLAAACLAGQAVRFGLPAVHKYLDFLVTEFYMDSEMNLPTFYAAGLSILIGLSLFFIAWTAARNGKPDRMYWIFLGLLFLFLPFDEIFSLHEMLTAPVQDRIYAVGVLYWPWFLPLLPVLAVLFLTYLRFLLRLPRRTFVLLMVSAALFLGGAIVIEALGAAFADEYGLGNFPYALIATVEEATELTGQVLFLYTLFDYYSRTFRKNQVV